MFTRRWSMSICIVTTSTIDTIMIRERRRVSRTRTGTSTPPQYTETRTIPTCTTDMITSPQAELVRRKAAWAETGLVASDFNASREASRFGIA